jgi:hypothetical protein
MGCVHTHWGRPKIERCDNINCVQSVVEKNEEDNWKVGKIDRTIGQIVTQGMLERVWCYKYSKNFEVKPFIAQWIVQKEEYTCMSGAIKDHMSPWRCCLKRKVLLLTYVKVSRRRAHWSTISLVVTIEITKAEFSK